MMFKQATPPMINMGGLAQFEKSARISAPGFIEQLIQVGTENPDAPLAPDMIDHLIQLIAHCFGSAGRAHRRAAKLLKGSPDLVALALRDFLEDPLPDNTSTASSGDAPAVELPSVLDMRAAWLADGGDGDVFDGLKLWEHARILRQQEKRQRAALADAAVAARVAQTTEQNFKRFVSETLGTRRAKTPREWAEHLFAATAHLPKVTQQELHWMKGRA